MSVDLPTLSVLVPVYNEEATLDLIVAKLHEVPIQMEIVAVNDCSTDQSAVILDRLLAEGRIDARGASRGEPREGRRAPERHRQRRPGR